MERARALTVGSPLDEATQLGPMVSSRQLERVPVTSTRRREQARLVLGGERLGGDGPTAFMAPTIFDDVRPEMSIAREEIFGPVLSVLTFDDEDEAIAIANETRSGWQRGLDERHRPGDPPGAAAARRRRLGQHPLRAAGRDPVRRLQGQGIGRELGMAGLDEYLESKRVCIDSSPTFHIR